MNVDSLARMHSAEHLLNGTMVQLFGCNRCFSAHINKKKSKCDYKFERDLTTSEIAELETRINGVIQQNQPVVEEFISREEANARFNLERLPEDAGQTIRIIKMGNYDAVPCSGNHVEQTSQIGAFKITTCSFENSILRIRFKLLDQIA